MKKKIGCLLAIALLLSGCGKIPKLKDGKEAVVTFKNGNKISVDELYENMKEQYALQTLINMIDKEVLEDEFKNYKKEANQKADTYIEALLSNYNSEDELLQILQSYYGFTSIEQYRDAMYLNYLKNYATTEYAKTLVTDKEIETYYDEEVYGDIEISHILITPKVTDEMTDTEIAKAEKDAEKKANELLKTLTSAKKKDLEKTFKSLAKENSDDEATSSDGGKLGRINKIGDKSLGEGFENLTEAAYSIKDGELYNQVIKCSDGYHIIYRSKSYDKAEIKGIKRDIIEKLAQDKIEEDPTIASTALDYYRKEAGMDIVDDEIANQYSNYLTNSMLGQ